MNLIRNYFSSAILSISLILLLYTLYQSEVFFNGERRYEYNQYYYISFLLIFFSIITFFINKKIKEYLIISVISFVFAVYMLEAYLIHKKLNSTGGINIEQMYEKQTGNKWDERSKHDVYESLKEKNTKISLPVNPYYFINNDKIFPLANQSNSEIIHCNENGYYSITGTDRFGFNNPDREWDKKNIEYLLVGDSLTMGSCVNRPHDIGSVLRILSNKPVLNLGNGGNGPIVEYATLREYLNPNVNKVLWIYSEYNDLQDITAEKKSKILMNYLNDLNFSQNLKSRQKEINTLLSNMIIERKKIIEKINENNFKNNINKKREETFKYKLLKFKHSNLIRFVKLSNLRFNFFSKITTPEPIQEFNKSLRMAKNLVNNNNSQLYFIYMPEFYRFKSNYKNTNYKLVKDIVENLDIPFIDMHKEVFEKNDKPLALFPFGNIGNSNRHYNIEGYKKVSNAIFKFTDN